MNDQEINMLVFIIDNILQEPNLLKTTKEEFVSFKNIFMSNNGTYKDVEKLNNLIEIKNNEVIALSGMVEFLETNEAADILTTIKNKKRPLETNEAADILTTLKKNR